MLCDLQRIQLSRLCQAMQDLLQINHCRAWRDWELAGKSLNFAADQSVLVQFDLKSPNILLAKDNTGE